MIGVPALLVTVSNTPHDMPLVVDIAGNGKSLLPVSAAEVRDGKLVIVCDAPARAPKPGKAPVTTVAESRAAARGVEIVDVPQAPITPPASTNQAADELV